MKFGEMTEQSKGNKCHPSEHVLDDIKQKWKIGGSATHCFEDVLFVINLSCVSCTLISKMKNKRLTLNRKKK